MGNGGDVVAQGQYRSSVALDRKIAREEQRVAILRAVHHRKECRQRPGYPGVILGRTGAAMGGHRYSFGVQ
jgi:hypothetical protein